MEVRFAQARGLGGRSELQRAGEALRRVGVVRTLAGLSLFGLVIGGLGCASSRVSDLDAYEKIPLNRVVPYPSQDELRKRNYEVIVVDRPAMGIDDSTLKKPRALVRRSLEGIAAEAGAAVIDRSLQDVSGIRTEGVLNELEGQEGEDISGADYALATRFQTYRYSALWKKPSKMLWQSEEDIAQKPGTCTHLTEVSLDIQVIEIGSNDRVSRTYSIEHEASQKNKDLDSACTIAPVTLDMMFETALEEALTCLDIPLGTLLSPRGHITEHRKAREAERHIYKVSLGSVQGLEADDEVEISREQRALSPSGEETRSERLIAKGVVTDQITPQTAWIALDPSKAMDAILDGDVVRPVLSEGLLSSLTGPNCKKILEVH